MRLRPANEWLFIFGLLLSISLCRAVTLEEIRATRNLTPQTFAAYFSNFEFKYHHAIQPPELFLATESGDCDDYATLASAVLKEKGYTTRLVTIRMPKVTHVVCYVEEAKCYLDYNNRAYLVKTVSSSPTIEDIASHVARSYHCKWTSASEFTYEEGCKRLVKTVAEPKAEESKFALFR